MSKIKQNKPLQPLQTLLTTDKLSYAYRLGKRDAWSYLLITYFQRLLLARNKKNQWFSTLHSSVLGETAYIYIVEEDHIKLFIIIRFSQEIVIRLQDGNKISILKPSIEILNAILPVISKNLGILEET